MSEPPETPKKKSSNWLWPFLGVLALAGVGSLIGGDEETESSESQSIEVEERTDQSSVTELEQEEARVEPKPEEFEWPPFEPILLEGSGDDVVVLADWTAVAGFFWLLGCFTGAACGNRTHDLLITSETLCQLS